MIKVVLTAGGSAGTLEAIRSLKARGDYEVIVADAFAPSPASAFADRVYIVPFGADARFADSLRELLAREKPDFIVPLVDEEIPKVHDLVEREFSATRIVGPKRSFAEMALDKWAMASALADAKLGTARTWLASACEDASYPAIIKPRWGRGSRGFALIDGPDSLATYLASASDPPDRYIVQERLDGRELTTSVVVALDGTVLAVVPKEATVKRGITQVGVTRAMPAIDAHSRAIAKALDPRGPFNIQAMLDRDGQPKVIEINPRYSSTLALTLAAGVDEIDAVLRHARGLDPGSLVFEPDLVMVRYTTQAYAKESAWEATDLR